MSTIVTLATVDGRIILRDLAYSPDEVLEAALKYREHAYAADDDREAGRDDHYDQFSAPARDQAGRDLENATAITLTWKEALELSDQLALTAARVRKAEAHKFTNPMMRKA